MPYIPDEEYKKLLYRIEKLEREQENTLKFSSKKLTLNDHLDVKKVNKDITDVESDITTINAELAIKQYDKKQVKTDVTVPGGYTWVRGEMEVINRVSVVVEDDAEIIIV